MTEIKQPKIRFKGYINDWEQRKLGDLAEIVGGGTPSTKVSEYWNGNIDWYAPAELGSKRYLKKSEKTITELGLKKSSAKLLPIGTVLFTSRAGIGNTAILEKEGTTNQGFQSIVPKSDILDTYFIYSRTKELKKYGETKGSGTTFIEISGKEMSKMNINVPNIEEQQKIGAFFKSLDDTIALHQQKLEVTKQFKQTMLKKMFPRNGKTKPEIRFKGFTEDWEQYKVNEIFKVTRGQVLATTEINEEQSETMPYPVYSSQTKNDGIMGYYKDYLFDTAITWTTDGANAGTVNYRSGKFYSTNVNGVLLSEEGYANKAIAEILNREAWKWVSHVGNPKLMNNVMGNIVIYIPPSFEEQNILSDFFLQLDDIIALHQQKLEILKEMKKTMLQKMFI